MIETALIIQCLTGAGSYTASAEDAPFRDNLDAVFINFNGFCGTYLNTIETSAAFIVIDAYIAGISIIGRQELFI
jgi:hypothetical protein